MTLCEVKNIQVAQFESRPVAENLCWISWGNKELT